MTVQARALAFATLVASFIAIIVTNRSWSHGFQAILRMPNAAQWWVVAIAAGAASIAWFEALKLWRRHRAKISRLSARPNPSFRDCAPRSS